MKTNMITWRMAAIGYLLLVPSLISFDALGGTGENIRIPQLSGQISDFRYFYWSDSKLKQIIVERKCFVDIQGRVFTTKGSPAIPTQLICSKGFTVGNALDKLEIDLKNIGGIQLRIFKRDQLIQTSRFLRNKLPNEFDRIRAIVLDPGDVLFFTPQE